MFRVLVLLLLLITPALCQDAVEQVSYWADPFGNQGSFWKVTIHGKTYVALKIKSPDKPGEANLVLDRELFQELEKRAGELHRLPNPLKNDGFQVVWSKQSGDATVRTLLARFQGIKVKLLQVEENKGAEGKFEHQITLDKSYNDFARAYNKLRPVIIVP